MALIKCPECGKEISDKSKQCIHCGFPLEELLASANATGVYSVVLERFVMTSKYVENKAEVIGYLQEIMDVVTADAENVLYHLPQKIADGIKKENIEAMEKRFKEIGCKVSFVPSDVRVEHPYNAVIEEKRRKNACPKCQSENVAISEKMGFFGNRKISCHCKDCGHDWKYAE